MFNLQIDKKKQKHMVKIFYMWMLCINIKRKKYKTVLCRIGIRQVTFDRMVMIVYRTYNFFLYLLCSWIIAIFKECLIKSRNSHCLYRYHVTLIVLD